MPPRLLLLSQTLPYPPDSGSKARTYQLLRQLSREFDITALCFYRREEFQESGVSAALTALSSLAGIEAFPIPQEYRRIRWLQDHFLSVTQRRVYTTFALNSAAFGRRLTALLQTRRFDLAYADSLDLSRWFPQLAGLPLICNHHDAQSVLLADRAAREPSLIRRWYLRHQAKLMSREERDWCQRVALNTVVSEPDRDRLRKRAPRARTIVVPNGVDLEHYQPRADPEAGVLFVGASTWAPNRDAMRYFSQAIAPRLRHLGAGASVRWVGRVAQVDAAWAAAHGIVCLGHVPDTRPWLAAAACVVAPLRIGSGTRIKILEAWAMGKAVVSTSIGCEGIEAIDGHNVLVRDDPEGFAEAVAAVSNDATLRARLGRAARMTVEHRYDWNSIGPMMNAAFLAIARRT